VSAAACPGEQAPAAPARSPTANRWPTPRPPRWSAHLSPQRASHPTFYSSNFRPDTGRSQSHDYDGHFSKPMKLDWQSPPFQNPGLARLSVKQRSEVLRCLILKATCLVSGLLTKRTEARTSEVERHYTCYSISLRYRYACMKIQLVTTAKVTRETVKRDDTLLVEASMNHDRRSAQRTGPPVGTQSPPF
jgi:hypothetical protein